MVKSGWLKTIKLIFLNKVYYEILRRINSQRPELISGDIDNILVIAPHPDDDVIGCGGILSKNRGKKIKVIFITDGRYGGDTCNGSELVKIRRKEAIDALNSLDIFDTEFLDIEDGKIGEHILEVSGMLKDLEQWNNIFIPNILDNHQDHKASVLAVCGALSRINGTKSVLWLYEIWSPLNPNVLVDITKEVDAKKNAVNKHLSQIKCYDYSNKILGLNSYRAISIPADQNVRFCEAFYKCSFKELLHILKISEFEGR